ncbi:sensor histidine kinase [Anaerobacillus isosaccharinicus]|uniref:Sensor histidine kinase n=1 Tax=Anaerobacillus isosaccharinicus TaxID=1532552 RepID=A0A1S2LC29_9BACI|nr:sensor histidine kinase [Anaerobacillus isosaccharinicus]MBA5584899.1 sensor histidine kinase [Anaerobacillus isosaccharinicus]QOY36741.1 sensor histidine kinase [Anaerobacillus isosaccharinicus]
MRFVQRQMIWSVLFSLILFAVFTVIYITIFPVENWSLLLDAKIYDFPIFLFVPGVAIALGVVFGLSNSLTYKKQLEMVEEALQQLEQGRVFDEDKTTYPEELKPVFQKVKNVQKQMADQVKTAQKLASEKAIDQEKIVQKIVSQERNRLARELHDSVSQQLFAASMLMSAITETKREEDGGEAKQLKLVEDMIHQSQLEMRALLLHLRPVPLKGKSLQEGMQELLNELAQKVPMEISWKIEAVPLEKGVEDHLFRILQESVSNTLRHSKATSLEVLLINRDDLIILRIADDGVGFDVSVEKAGSYGLQNMHERAKEIGGALKVVSLKNKGTRLEVKVPLMVGD